MFLMPDGRPIVGGTYWPPDDKKEGDDTYPGFKTIVKAVRDAYKDKPEGEETEAKGGKKKLLVIVGDSKTVIGGAPELEQ